MMQNIIAMFFPFTTDKHIYPIRREQKEFST